MARYEYSPIPYGITDFVTIREGGYYYVDKTMFIPQLEFDAHFAFCLRPRRFGKSLLLSMLDCYYDVAYADRFDELFTGLDIHDNPTSERGKYLIMKFNFSRVDSRPGKVQESFNEVCLSSLRDFVDKYSALLPEDTLQQFLKETSCNMAMNVVCTKAKQAGRRVYLMIDEYDNFANTILSRNEGEYQQLTHGDGFFRLFFNCVKAYTTGTDSAVQRIFITGVSPLTLSDVTSGFNIGFNLSMRPEYNELVGFSESQVRDMLDYYRAHTTVPDMTNDEVIAIIKPWYNNYCFAFEALDGERMFNTDMVMYFMTSYIKGRIPSVMVDTNVSTDYAKMQQLVRFESTYGEKTQMLQGLLADGQICTYVNPEFTIQDMDSPDNLYSLLYYLGLLSFSGEDFGMPILSIPNEVVKLQYCQYLSKCYENTLNFTRSAYKMDNLMREMAKNGDWKPFFEFIATRMQEVSSIRDYIDGESFIKAFFLANMSMGRENAYYDFPSELEYGKGYVDIVMSPRGPVKDLYLVELKYCKADASDAEIERLRADAIDQLGKYSVGPDFQALVTRNNWRYHGIVIVFRSWKMEVFEKIAIATAQP